jgi:hypothetical protein
MPAKPDIYESDEHRHLTGRIRIRMEQIEQRLKIDPSAKLVAWITKDQLATSQRPLRVHPDWETTKPPDYAGPLVMEWVRRIREEEGIRSIICLLTDDELELNYGHLGLRPPGLLAYYESVGLKVKRRQMTDNLETPFLAAAREAAKLFQDLPKPVLVHCAAAADRTPSVAALIALRHEGEICL